MIKGIKHYYEIYHGVKFDDYGKERYAAVEGTDDAHEYYSRICKSKELFNKLPPEMQDLAKRKNK